MNQAGIHGLYEPTGPNRSEIIKFVLVLIRVGPKSLQIFRS